jgi:hypothetical protein
MNAAILEMLKERRQMVSNRFESMVAQATRMNKKYILDQKFFFTVVANHFENMSVVMTNKILKGGSVFFLRELNKAVDAAEYACAKGERNENRQYFNNLSK